MPQISNVIIIIILASYVIIPLIYTSTAVFFIVRFNKTHIGVFISTTIALLLSLLPLIICGGVHIIPIMLNETRFQMGFLAFSAFMYYINHFLFNKRIHKKTDHPLPK